MLPSTELDDLIAELVRQGFRLTIEQRAELLLLLADHAEAQARPVYLERVGRLIGPLVCTTAAEQARFGAVYSAWAERTAKTAGEDALVPALATTSAEAAGASSQAPGAGGPAAPLPSKWASVFGCLALLVTLFLLAFNVEDLRIERPLGQGEWTVPDRLGAAPGARSHRGASIRNNDGTGMLRLFGLAAPLIVFAVWLQWRFRSRAAVLGRYPAEQDPGIGRFVARGDCGLFSHNALSRLMDFRRWHQHQPRGVDLERTIDATARSAGRIVVVPRSVGAPRSFVALIEKRHAEDHGARFAQLLIGQLKERELRVDGFVFADDPQWLRPLGKHGVKEPVELERVRRRYPQGCFLLFVEPERCLDPLTARPLPWLTSLADEHACALLALESDPAGTAARAVVAAGCTVVPCTLAGLASIPTRLEHPAAQSPPGAAHKGRAPPATQEWNGDPQALVARLQGRLTPQTLHWLAALAVYPRLAFDLTLYLGAHLKDAEGHRLLSESRLASISALRWLREGAIPDAAREDLIETLSKSEQAEVRRLLYQVIGAAILDRPEILASAQPPDRETREVVRAFVRTRAGGDPLVDRVFSRFLLYPGASRQRFHWPERLARLLGFEVHSVPLVFVLLAVASVGLLGWVVDFIEAEVPAFNAWVADHRMWVGIVLYLVTIGAWSGFWTSVMLSPRYEKFTSELWRRRVRLDDVHPPA